MSVLASVGYNNFWASRFGLARATHHERAAMSLEGAISTMGKTRDDDGTVDRVADPPDEMWPVLAAIKYRCDYENMHLDTIFVRFGPRTPPGVPAARSGPARRPARRSPQASLTHRRPRAAARTLGT